MKKKIIVTTLAEELLDIHGTASKQRDRVRLLSEVYSKSFTKESVLSTFWFEHPIEIKGSKRLHINEEIYFPETISDFVSICASMKIPLYWDEEIYTSNIHHHFRYKNIRD